LISSRVTSHGPSGPNAAALGLEVPLRDVVADAVAGDVVQRVLFGGDVASAGADHEGDLDLVVELRRALRDHHVVVGTDDAVGELVEQDRLGRDRRVGLLGVIDVVKADGDEVAHGADRRPEPHALRRQRQRVRVDGAQLVEAGRPEHVAGDVLDVGRQVAHGALRVDETGLLGAGRAKSDKLHCERSS
jgi:hypothetical protein